MAMRAVALSLFAVGLLFVLLGTRPTTPVAQIAETHAAHSTTDTPQQPVPAAVTPVVMSLAPSAKFTRDVLSVCGYENGNDRSREHDRPQVWKMQCPPAAVVAPQFSNNDTEMDRRSEWVVRKYNYYATRCKSMNGMMWKKLSREAHDKIANKVLALLYDDGPVGGDAEVSRIFDWACGCGATLKHFHTVWPKGRTLEGFGLDLTDGAIGYARKHSAAPGLLFCQGDGTRLDWIPDATFHHITSFGGLLHLPRPFMCDTIRHLLRILKPGGKVWAGYIDNRETAEMLRSCRVPCAAGESVTVSTVVENEWLVDVGMPDGQRKRNPVSLVWSRD